MKIVLGILLTAVAGFVGVATGALAAYILSLILFLLIGDQPGQIWDIIFQLLFGVLMIGGCVGGIAIGWFSLLRRPRDIANAFNPKQCLECGYDLSGNLSGRCPECGKGIDRNQARHLALK